MQIGINQSNLLQMNDVELNKQCAAMADFGFDSVRFAVDWAQMNSLFFATNFGSLSRVAKALVSHGLTPMPVLGCHLPWGGDKGVDAWAVFVRKCLDILGPLPYYEVWNEPNLPAFKIGGPQTYVKYLRAANGVIRQIQGAKIISAGMAAYSSSKGLFGQTCSPADFLSGMYISGEHIGTEPDLYDYFGNHPYTLTNEFFAKYVSPRSPSAFGMTHMDKLDKTREVARDTRPYAFTEIGYDTGKVAIKDCVTYLESQLMDLHSLYPDAPIWLFTWKDTPGDGGNLGIVDKNNKPKGDYYDFVKGILVNGLPD